jgi:hypothetical protein
MVCQFFILIRSVSSCSRADGQHGDGKGIPDPGRNKGVRSALWKSSLINMMIPMLWVRTNSSEKTKAPGAKVYLTTMVRLS